MDGSYLPVVAIIATSIILAVVLRGSGRTIRRYLLGKGRGYELQVNFPDYRYRKYANPGDVAGLERFPDLVDSLEPGLGNFLQGGCAEIHHLLTAEDRRASTKVFDLRIPAKSGGHPSTKSVLLLCQRDLGIPTFRLSQESIGNISIWGKDPDIDLPEFRRFSQNYFLESDDEHATRHLFENGVAAFIDKHTLFFSHVTIRSAPGVLLIEGQRLSPEKLCVALDTCSQLMHKIAEIQSG